MRRRFWYAAGLFLLPAVPWAAASAWSGAQWYGPLPYVMLPVDGEQLPPGAPGSGGKTEAGKGTGMGMESPLDQGVIPQALRQPRQGETLRYPRDAVIGELGRGDAPGDAYQAAQTLLRGALSGNRESALLQDADPALLAELFTTLESMEPKKFRLGGGRLEADGSVSFLFRFLGREQSLAGEIYFSFKVPGAAPPAEAASPEAAPPAAAPVDVPPDAVSTAAPPAQPPPPEAAAPVDTVVVEAPGEAPPAETTPPEAAAAETAENPPAAARWILEEITLEDPRPLASENKLYKFDASTYERFY